MECNVDKTVLVQIGDKTPPSQDILDLGFSIQTRITILGAIVDNDSGNLEPNIKKTEDMVLVRVV